MGALKHVVLSIVAAGIIIGLALLSFNKTKSLIRKGGAGYPALEGQLEKSHLYEVLGGVHVEDSFLTITREADGRFRFFNFRHELEPGFYRWSGTNLVSANPKPAVLSIQRTN